MGWSNPTEIATINVNGMDYTDWTAVTVIEDADEAYSWFQFECTEFTPVPTAWASLKIKPGDECTVTLGGVQRISGYVMERHVNFDGRQHQIMILGMSRTHSISISSILPSTNGKYDGMSFKDIAKRAAGYHGVQCKFVGDISDKIFEHSQHLPGEITWNFILRHANMRNVMLGNTAQGELLGVGPHNPMPSGKLVEGENILRANCIISDQYIFNRIASMGQSPGHDPVWGDPANKGAVEKSSIGLRPVFMTHFADTPTADQVDLIFKADTLKRFTEGTLIRAGITVQGWFQGDGKPWLCRDYYNVTSPMLMLTGDLLACKRIVYDQREGAGTTTMMEMVSPILLNGIPGKTFSGPNPTTDTSSQQPSSVFDTGTTAVPATPAAPGTFADRWSGLNQ